MYKSHLEVSHNFISPEVAVRSPEVAVRILSTESLFLKISQNSQQSTCAGVSFYYG